MDIAEVSSAVWAKSYPRVGNVQTWLPLWRHLDDTAAVTQRLWREWLPGNVRRQIAAPLGGSDDDARMLTAFLAGVHDVGKASPAFAVQVPALAAYMQDVGLKSAPLPENERRSLRHELAGQVALESWLVERFGWEKQTARQLGIVVGGHHGVPPDHRQLRDACSLAHRHLLGDGLWEDTRDHLIERSAQLSGAYDNLAGWRDVRLPQPVQVLLTGIVIVADWIASNDDLFPLADINDRRPEFDHDARVGRAWADLDLPSPWRPTMPGDDADAILAGRFGLPAGVQARPVQAAALTTANTMDLPGLMVVEAPMGEGKTEAALLAAEALAARTDAGGCFVALPTQATSDAMFLRVLEWLARLPDAELAGDAADEARGARSVTLSHGKATLNPAFRELRMWRGHSRAVAPDADGDQAPGHSQARPDVIAHGWLHGRKKGALASFMVGTVDQLLFMGLRARHLALRHLGLAGKVVIVDEVHAYDAYMGVYLTRAIEWLGAYGVPVVLLSATLPEQTRADLMNAYQRGVDSRTPPARENWRTRRKDWQKPAPLVEQVTTHAAPVYPAITARVNGATVGEPVDAAGRSMAVRIETAEDDPDVLVGLLDDALVDGGCALVVRNTVRRAQQCASYLREKFGNDVALTHSRFLACDRADKDARLRELFGPPGPDGTSPNRPWRKIVVATQVVEQSLDVDFDLLVTDLAPVDLMLQRNGRMHRHRRGDGERRRPRTLRGPRCVVVGVEDWSAEPPKPTSGSTYVYDKHVLYRAAALLDEVRAGDGVITLPDDIAVLVQRAYGDARLGHETWQSAMTEARRAYEEKINVKRDDAGTFRLREPGFPGAAIVGWLHGHLGEADEDSARGKAQVRDGEDTVEVIVLQVRDGQLRIPDWVADRGGELVPMNEPPSDALAEAVAACAIRLPGYLTAGAKGEQLIDAIEQSGWFPQFQHHRLLAGELMLTLDDDRRATRGPWSFHYDRDDGLEVSEA